MPELVLITIIFVYEGKFTCFLLPDREIIFDTPQGSTLYFFHPVEPSQFIQ